MVYEHDEPNYIFELDGSSSNALPSALADSSLSFATGPKVDAGKKRDLDNSNGNAFQRNGSRLSEIRIAETPYHQQSFMQNNWSALAESTLPLRTSEFLTAACKRNYGGAGDGVGGAAEGGHLLGSFNASVECRSREISRKLIYVNLVSVLINLGLALVAFYFAFVNNSSSTSAFATDCVLDFISSAIVLWRYCGDLNNVYMHAREKIACMYLGALFEISALGIIIKASSDIASGVGAEEGAVGYDLIYLAVAATIACIVLTSFKCSLYKTTRDNSIMIDVINTLISTIFAMSIIMSQLLINIDLSFWYLDPILSIVLAIFMAGFGLKVIHQNFDILRPSSSTSGHTLTTLSLSRKSANRSTDYHERANYKTNLNASVDMDGTHKNWQKADYSSVAFI